MSVSIAYSRVRSWLAEAEARHAQRSVGEEFASAAFVVAPVILLLVVFIGPALSHTYMPDFTTFLRAGRAVLAGVNPYPPAHKALLANGGSFVYPAPAAVVMAPLARLPYVVAAGIWTVVSLGSIVGALRLLGVRDVRCYGVTFLTVWGVNSVLTGSISPLLLLGLAALWRYRDRLLVAAALLAAIVCLKLYLWPLILWAAFTGRRRAAALGVLFMAVLCLSAWAVIDFKGLASYPHLLATLASSEQLKSYSPLALLLGLGASPLAAKLAVGILGVGCLCAAAVVAHRHRPSSDATALTLCLVTALVCTPIVWPHYLLLLLVPVAIAHKRLSFAWLVPLATWISFGAHSKGPVTVVLELSVAAAVLVAAHWTVSAEAGPVAA